MERKAPKVDPISSIPCDEGGKRHIKGCPHKTTSTVKEDYSLTEEEKNYLKNHPAYYSTWSFGSGYTDRSTFNKEQWEVAYIELLESNLKTLSLHRAVFAAVLTILAVVTIVR